MKKVETKIKQRIIFILFTIVIFLLLLCNNVRAINLAGTEINGMPALANWVKTETEKYLNSPTVEGTTDPNKFLTLPVNQLLGKNVKQKAYDNSEIDTLGGVGAVSANNGMCLYEGASNGATIDTYTIYNVVDLIYNKDSGYGVTLYRYNEDKVVKNLSNAQKSNVARLIQAFKNINDSGVIGCCEIKPSIRKNEAKYYIYSLKSLLGLDKSPVAIPGDKYTSAFEQNGGKGWLYCYAKGGTNSATFEGTAATVKIDNSGKASVINSSGTTIYRSNTKYFDKTEEYVNKINNYSISKTTTKPLVTKYEKVGTEYKSIIGPFKINYNGANIASITAKKNGTKIANNKIEWATSYSATSWNKCSENKNLPKNKNFYIRISSSEDDTSLDFEVELEELTYYNARCIVATCPGGQNQTSMIWGLSGRTITKKVEWDVNITPSKLIIKKNDYDTNAKLNAQFAIFYEKYDKYTTNEPQSGWLGYDSTSGLVTYGKSWSNAKKFETGSDGKFELSRLLYGKYYVIEIKAPDNYKLSEQPGYKAGSDYSFLTNNNWKMGGINSCIIGKNSYNAHFLNVKNAQDKAVKMANNYVFLGYTSTNKQYTYEVKNSKSTLLTINKVGEKGVPLSGIGFKILVKNIGGNYGWLKQDGSLSTNSKDAYKFVTDSRGSKSISNIPYGTYYIYEVEIPDKYKDEYKLETQKNYDVKRPTNYTGSFISKHYVYCGYTKISSEVNIKSVTITNTKEAPDTPSLTIEKIDEETDEKIPNTGMKILVKTTENKWGWLKQNGDISTKATEAYEFKTDSNGNIEINDVQLKYGTYYIYETTPNENYKLEDQQYYNLKKPKDFVGDFYTGTFINTPYAYLDKAEITENNKNASATTYNRKIKRSITIRKKDSNYKENSGDQKDLYLEGAYIKIKYTGENTEGWLQEIGEDEKTVIFNAEENNATQFKTDSDGVIEIDYGLKDGTYEFFEVDAPEGYDITKQKDYDTEKGWVYLGSEKIEQGNYNPEKEVSNIKAVSITGKVWVDNPLTKVNGYNDIYNDYSIGDNQDTSDEEIDIQETIITDENAINNYESMNQDVVASNTSSADVLLDGITVRLFKGNTLIAEETTKNGVYTFTEKNKTSNPNEKINYWELPYCYVEFVYDNTTYVVVTPFKNGEDEIENNSKAQPKEVKTTGGVTNLDSDRNNAGELYDGNLSGTNTNSEFYGSAITYNSGDTTNLSKEKIEENANLSLNQRFLTGFYNEDNYTVENINLGLIAKLKPSFDVGQQLEFVKIVKGNYSFTYQYGKNFVVDVNNEGVKYTQDTVAFEKKDRTFTQYIYPSDIAYNFAEERAENDKYEVYVVYKVMIRNNTTYNLQDLYKEYTLRLTDLSYTYDSTKYQLDKKDIGYENSGYTGTDQEINEHIENIKSTLNNWNEADNNKLKWNLAETDEVRAGNVGNIYVQFKVKDEALQELLQSIDGNLPEIKTKAIATGYHIYNRKDKNWAYTGNYSHFTKDDTKESAAYGFGLQLKDKRTISGSIFEDSKDETRTNERIGNGLKDDGENKISGVVVSLIDASKNEVAKLYDRELEQYGNMWKPKSQDATIVVGSDGTYNLQGVVPGKYYLRFTYGNGDVSLKQLNGEEITQNIQTTKWYTDENGAQQSSIINGHLYKSTILTGAAKDVNEDNEKTWFLNNGQNSIAIDNTATIDDRIKPSNEAVELNHSNLQGQQLISADSPNMNIQFEGLKETFIDANSIDTVKPICEGMNFGIIERPHVDIQLDKNIKNVKFTLQNGTTIINGNPNDQNVSSSLSSWADPEGEFNSTAKIELDSSLLYGSDISVSYEMVAHNESELDYATENYYKYGIIENPEDIVKTAVTRIVDYIDNGNAKYQILSNNITVENLDESIYLTEEAKAVNKNFGKKALVAKGEGTEIGKLLTPSVKAIDGSDRETYEIIVSNLLSSSDTLYGWENYSEIVGIRNKTKTPQSTSHFGSLEIKNPKTDEPDDADATIILTSTTGENRDLTIYYIITGAFVVLAIGLIFIIKKHKNK